MVGKSHSVLLNPLALLLTSLSAAAVLAAPITLMAAMAVVVAVLGVI
jgi:hypothetical protein